MNGQARTRLNTHGFAAALEVLSEQHKLDALQKTLRTQILLASSTPEFILEVQKTDPDTYGKWESAVYAEYHLIGRRIIDTISQTIHDEGFSRKHTCSVQVGGKQKFLKRCPFCHKRGVPFHPITPEMFKSRYGNRLTWWKMFHFHCKHEIPVTQQDQQIINNMVYLMYN